MEDVPDELAGQLRRQRRFLVLMSLGVIAYFVFGLDLESKLDYAGMTLKARDPRYALWALWVVWGWSVLRFLQCGYKALSLVSTEIREEVDAEADRIVMRKAGKIAVKQVREGKRENVPKGAVFLPPVKFGMHSQESVRASTVLKADISTYYTPEIHGGRTYPNIYANFRTTAGGYFTTVRIGMNMALSRWDMMWVRVRAWLYATLAMPGISEHVMPVLLAVAAVVAALTLDPNACHTAWCQPGAKPTP
jgi:hypothetical protein